MTDRDALEAVKHCIYHPHSKAAEDEAERAIIAALCAPAVTGAAPMTPTREQLEQLEAELIMVETLMQQSGTDPLASCRNRVNAMLAAIATQEAAPMPPIEVGDWVHEDGEKEAVIVRETHQAKSLNRGIRRSGVTEIRKANGTVWRRP